MRTGFRGYIIAFLLRFFDLLGDIRAADMTNMHFAPGRFGQFDNRCGRDQLSHNRSRIQKCVPVGFSRLLQDLFAMHDCRKVFAMETGFAAKLFQDLHRFVGLSVIQRTETR